MQQAAEKALKAWLETIRLYHALAQFRVAADVLVYSRDDVNYWRDSLNHELAPASPPVTAVIACFASTIPALRDPPLLMRPYPTTSATRGRVRPGAVRARPGQANPSQFPQHQ